MKSNCQTDIFIFLLVLLNLIFVATTLLFGKPVWLVLAVVLVLSFVIIAFNPLVGLISILVSTFVFERYFTLQGVYGFQMEGAPIYLMDLIFAMTLLSVLARRLAIGRLNFNLGLNNLLIVFYLIFCLLGLVVGTLKGNDLILNLATFKNYFVYVFFYFLTISLVTTKTELKLVLRWLMGSGVLLIFFIAAGMVTGQGIWSEFTPLSTVGSRLLAGTHAYYLTIPLVLGLVVFSTRRNQKSSPFLILLMVVWLTGLLLSLQRHLWISVGVGILFLLLTLQTNEKFRFFKILTVGLAFFTTFIIIIKLLSSAFLAAPTVIEKEIFSAISSRFYSLSTFSSDVSAVWRLDIWREVLGIIISNPLLGVGFGHQIIQSFPWGSFIYAIREVHNSFLALAAQVGLTGLLIFLAIFVDFFIQALRRLKETTELRPELLSVMTILLIFFVAANFGTYLEINLFVILPWVFLGLGQVILKLSDQDNKPLKQS